MIKKDDAITQMICVKCVRGTRLMYKFRETSMKNDKALNAKASGSKLTSETSTLAIPHSVKIPYSQKYQSVHPSIKKLIKQYPNIKLPKIILNAHVEPYITVLIDEVDDWYRQNNYSDNDIEERRRVALDYALEFETNPPKKRGRKRKLPLESTSLTATKLLSSDNTNSSQSDMKRVNLSSELNLKTVKASSTDPSCSIEQKMSFTKLEAHYDVNANNILPTKSKAVTTVKSSETANANTSTFAKQFNTQPSLGRIVKPIFDSESDISNTIGPNVTSKVKLTTDSTEVISSIKAKTDNNLSKEPQRMEIEALTHFTRKSFLKSLFLKSLHSNPEYLSNQPDLSLGSKPSKASRFHVCNICHSHHCSLKQLKRYQTRSIPKS